MLARACAAPFLSEQAVGDKGAASDEVKDEPASGGDDCIAVAELSTDADDVASLGLPASYEHGLQFLLRDIDLLKSLAENVSNPMPRVRALLELI